MRVWYDSFPYLFGGGVLLIYDIYEDAQLSLPPVPFYLGNRLLPIRGKMELCGEPGIMKSFLALSLGFCFATGQPWLGIPTIQARTLLCQFEMSYEVEHERHTDMSRVYTLEPQMYYATNCGYLPLDVDASFNEFMEGIAPIEPKIIILDYWRCCYAGDENASEQVVKFTKNLDKAIRERGVSFVLLHHTNKNPLYTSGMDKSSGSHALPGWMDTVLFVAKQPTGIQIQFAKTRHVREGHLPSMNVIMEDMNWRVR